MNKFTLVISAQRGTALILTARRFILTLFTAALPLSVFAYFL